MGKTIAEKVFSKKSGRDVTAGMSIIAEVDKIMTNDASGPLSLSIMKKYGYESAVEPEKVAIFMDHYTPCPNDKVAILHQSIVDFHRANPGTTLTMTGCGICHQLMDEFGFIEPGSLIIGGDSHSTTYGFLNAIGVGVGSTDIAISIITGRLWFKVPETIKVNFVGKPKKNITGKDVALYLVSLMGPDGGNYKAIEFGGEGLINLDIDDRKTICNMLAECGAKCGIMPFDEIAQKYCETNGINFSQATKADKDCEYVKVININLDFIEYQVAIPHNVHTTKCVEELKDTEIDMALLGTCTGGKLKDFKIAAGLLKKCRGKFRSEVLIVPASQSILIDMIKENIISVFIEKGAMVLPAGCGPCCGSSSGVPRSGFNVISTANRNFIGRMGNVDANIYLASPLVVAASAMMGKIVDPKEVV